MRESRTASPVRQSKDRAVSATAKEWLVHPEMMRIQCTPPMIMKIRRNSLLAIAAAAFTVLSAAHRADASAGAPPVLVSTASGPCSLLTQAEVETALGKGASMSSVRNPRTGMDECRLKPAQAGKIQEIIVVVLSAQGWDMVKKSLVDGKDVKDVRGLGDDAFAGSFIGYNVRKGQKYVKVFGPLTNDAAANDKATHYLAEKAVSRL
jgi:hypothetical protein